MQQPLEYSDWLRTRQQDRSTVRCVVCTVKFAIWGYLDMSMIQLVY